VRAGDQILAVDGVAVRSWTDVTDDVARHDPSAPVLLSVQRDGAPLALSIQPDVDADTGHARIGVRTVEANRPKTLGSLVTGSASTTWGLFTQTGQSLGSVASVVADLPAQFLGHSSHPERRFLSPLGAARVADDQASSAGPAALFGLAASVSMFLALFNLLPVPPLDGGHIAVATYEAIASRVRRRVVRVDRRKLAPLTTAVILLVTIIGVSSIALDIIRPLAVH
jgi:membrane-associated protease RseP (regulator of RpoE activity)